MASAYESLSVEELVDKLEEASLQGDAETVKAIASAGADVADDENKTALYTAAENGNESAVKALIEAGADVNKATDSEMFPTALFQAVDEGHEAIVKMLIDAGADLDAVNDDGSTALAMATTRDKETEKQETEAIAKMLIAAGADLNKARTDGGATPLFAAAAWGQEAIVKALIDAGADVNTGLDDEEGETPLCVASKEGHLAVVKALIAAGADVNKPDGEMQAPALIHAMGDDEKTGENTDAIAIALIEAGANIAEKPGSLAGVLAARDGRRKVIVSMIAAGWDVDADFNDGGTALTVAAHKGHVTIAKALIAAGADVNKEDDNGETPLVFALRESKDDQWTGPGEDPGLDDKEAIFKALIAAGADATKPNLMEIAKEEYREKAIEIMVAAGATRPEESDDDVNDRSKW